jgi:hypothetical protein
MSKIKSKSKIRKKSKKKSRIKSKSKFRHFSPNAIEARLRAGSSSLKGSICQPRPKAWESGHTMNAAL